MPHALGLGCQTNPPGSNLISLGALRAPSLSQLAFGQNPNKTDNASEHYRRTTGEECGGSTINSETPNELLLLLLLLLHTIEGELPKPQDEP